MTAIYARQSVEKTDSISIETQIQTCIARLPRGEAYEIYADRGWSGATNRRPELERMMECIRAGRISCVAVYKLDRLGRSLRNFLELLDELRCRDVVLMAENITLGGADAYGRLLVGLMMSFAELERDTIIRRVTDNYYERGRNGMFLGGIAPFGFRRTVYRQNGKKIKGLIAEPDSAEIVKSLFERSASDPGASLGQLARWLNQQGIVTVRGNPWSSAAVGRLLHNPVYVRADASVFRYLKSRGSTITTAQEDFDGRRGLYLYGTAKGRTATKYADFRALTVSIAPHEGIVSSALWLACQHRLAENRALNGREPATWLTGLIHCAHCGYACSVTGRGKSTRYLTCGGRKMGICRRKSRPLTAEEVENAVYGYLCEEVNKLICLSTKPEERLKVLEKERNACLDAFSQVSDITARALDEKLCALEREYQALTKLNGDMRRENRLLSEFPARWERMDTHMRRDIACIFVRDVRVSEEEIRIVAR